MSTATDVGVPPPAPVRPPPGPARGAARLLARAWGAPLAAHVLALALVLIALVPVVGTRASFSADEGAAIIQARHLSEGNGWIVDHPVPGLGPGGHYYPLELSAQGAKGAAPFAKHPLYALVLAGMDRAGGVTAMVALSLAATLVAAVLAAALADRMGAGLSRPALWVVGLYSPLLFDGYLVIAHTLAAALAAAAVLFAMRALERPRPAAVGAMAACLVVAVLLRTEAVFFAAGLGVACVMALPGGRRRIGVVLAAAAVASAAVAHFGELAWARALVGGQAAVTGGPPGGPGGLQARLSSLSLTWLRPSYDGPPLLDLALLVMVAAVVVGSLAVRRHPGDSWTILGMAGLAAVAALVALGIGPDNLTPGLLVAFPVMAAGLVLLPIPRRRRADATAGRDSVPAVALATTTFGVFAAAVAATQYPTGGSGEWGGRYFALGLPVVVPALVLGLAQAGARLDGATRRWAVASLVVCSLAMGAMGVGSLRHTHRFTAALLRKVDAAARPASTARPVVVSTSPAVPRLAWRSFDRQRWLLSRPQDLGPLVAQLRSRGVDRVALVTDELRPALTGLGPSAEVVAREGAADGGQWQVVVLQLRSGSPPP